VNRSQLRQIAKDMRAELPQIGRSERVVDRTFLQLLRRNEVIQLTIGHPDHYVCIEDAQQVAEMFGVDEFAEPKAGIARIASQDGRSIPVKAMTYAWRESAGAAG